jgi:hypothetical protein
LTFHIANTRIWDATLLSALIWVNGLRDGRFAGSSEIRDERAGIDADQFAAESGL